MKTKKEILEWYLKRGKKEKTAEGWYDYFDFWNRIDRKNLTLVEKKEEEGEIQKHQIKIMKDTWKYPVKLFFYNLECYRIVGF